MKINEIKMNNSIVYPKSTKLHIYKQSMDNSKWITSEIHVFDNWWVLSMKFECTYIYIYIRLFILVNCMLNSNINAKI